MPPTTTTTTATVRVLLLRHGEREDETEGYDRRRHSRQEKVDPALTALGHRQALHAWQNILRVLEDISLDDDDDDDTGEEEEEEEEELEEGGGARPRRQRRVLLAASPLRRCMGTAVMVAAAAANDSESSSNIDFVLPMRDTDEKKKRTTSNRSNNNKNDEIPVLIMNGLADCAAQMQSMGGVGKVVPEGWLQCAASPSNDDIGYEEKSEVTPLQNCLGEICRVATDVLNVSENTALEQHPLAGEEYQVESPSMTALQFRPRVQSRPIQFWRETKYYQQPGTCSVRHVVNGGSGAPPPSARGGMVPMTSIPQTLQDYAAVTPVAQSFGRRTHNGHDIPQTMHPNVVAEDEGCEFALDRAVLQAVRAGADTCVLVTHREAIRFLEKTQEFSHQESEEDRQQRFRLYQESKRYIRMYCCVGVYQVQVETATSASDTGQIVTRMKVVKWKSQGVFPYQLLDMSKLA